MYTSTEVYKGSAQGNALNLFDPQDQDKNAAAKRGRTYVIKTSSALNFFQETVNKYCRNLRKEQDKISDLAFICSFT